MNELDSGTEVRKTDAHPQNANIELAHRIHTRIVEDKDYLSIHPALP